MSRKRKRQHSSRKQLNQQLIAHYHPKSSSAEQYRKIRSNIAFAAVDEEIHSLAVTSAHPSEGKTTTTANLAIVMAQQEKKVLLVDADMRKPMVHYLFNNMNTQGLTNVLTDQLEPQDAIGSTDIDYLDILPSGPIPPNPAELLGSKVMSHMLGWVHEHYDIVIFDTPPTLAVTDAQVVSSQCQGVLFVVASGQSDKESTAQAVDTFRKANIRILGTVLNRMPEKKMNYYYYYGSSS